MVSQLVPLAFNAAAASERQHEFRFKWRGWLMIDVMGSVLGKTIFYLPEPGLDFPPLTLAKASNARKVRSREERYLS